MIRISINYIFAVKNTPYQILSIWCKYSSRFQILFKMLFKDFLFKMIWRISTISICINCIFAESSSACSYPLTTSMCCSVPWSSVCPFSVPSTITRYRLFIFSISYNHFLILMGNAKIFNDVCVSVGKSCYLKVHKGFYNWTFRYPCEVKILLNL